MIAFKEYMRGLEVGFLVRFSHVLGKVEFVPVREGRLANTYFGKRVGKKFQSDKVVAIDYYGLYKKSTGLLEEIASMRGKQVRMIEATVVHFASIRIESVLALAPAQVAGFVEFKNMLLEMRGFKKQEGIT